MSYIAKLGIVLKLLILIGQLEINQGSKCANFFLSLRTKNLSHGRTTDDVLSNRLIQIFPLCHANAQEMYLSNRGVFSHERLLKLDENLARFLQPLVGKNIPDGNDKLVLCEDNFEHFIKLADLDGLFPDQIEEVYELDQILRAKKKRFKLALEVDLRSAAQAITNGKGSIRDLALILVNEKMLFENCMSNGHLPQQYHTASIPTIPNPVQESRTVIVSAVQAGIKRKCDQIHSHHPVGRPTKSCDPSPRPTKNYCECKKTKCLKKYCTCFAANMKCAKQCKCEDCGNQPGDIPPAKPVGIPTSYQENKKTAASNENMNMKQRLAVLESMPYDEMRFGPLVAKDEAVPRAEPEHCRERYTNHLDPVGKKGNWTPYEDGVIKDLQRTLGNKWTEISDCELYIMPCIYHPP